MKRLAVLKRELAELQAQGASILDAADTAGRDLTDAEEASFAKIEGEITAKKAEIASAERHAERRRAMEPVPVGLNDVHEPNPEQTGGFKGIDEFAHAVHRAVNPNIMERDARLNAAGPSNLHQGGASSGEGFELPPQFRDEVWELVTDVDEFDGLLDEEPTSAREVKLNSDETTPWGASGIKAFWRSEGSKMDSSKLAQEPRSVPLHELYTLAVATEELLEDAPRLANRLTRKAALAIAWAKNQAVVYGDGIGKPLGWFKSGALVTVPKVADQPADTIVVENIVAMYARLLSVPGDSPFWMINRNTLPQLMTMKIGDQPIWLPPNGLAGAPLGLLLGLPVRESMYSRTLGDKGDVQLVSPRGYYAARRSAGVSFASSMHLFFDYNAQAFRWVFRFGGQPHLKAPMLPAESADTRSHFVTLAERA